MKTVRFAVPDAPEDDGAAAMAAAGGAAARRQQEEQRAEQRAQQERDEADLKRRLAATFGPLVNVHARTAARTEINEQAEQEYERDMLAEGGGGTAGSYAGAGDLRDAIDAFDGDAAQPDHVLHPERYTKYSLEDVDVGADASAAEHASALAFIRSLRQQRSGTSSPDGDEGPEPTPAQRRAAATAATRGRRGPVSSSAAASSGGWRAFVDASPSLATARDGDGGGDGDRMDATGAV